MTIELADYQVLTERAIAKGIPEEVARWLALEASQVEPPFACPRWRTAWLRERQAFRKRLSFYAKYGATKPSLIRS